MELPRGCCPWDDLQHSHPHGGTGVTLGHFVSPCAVPAEDPSRTRPVPLPVPMSHCGAGGDTCQSPSRSLSPPEAAPGPQSPSGHAGIYSSPFPAQMGWPRFGSQHSTHITPAQGSPTLPQFWAPGTFLSPAVPALCPAASQQEQGCLSPLKGILGLRIQTITSPKSTTVAGCERSLEPVENKVHDISWHGLGLT